MLWIIALVAILIVSLIIVIKAADIFVDKIVEIGGIMEYQRLSSVSRHRLSVLLSLSLVQP